MKTNTKQLTIVGIIALLLIIAFVIHSFNQNDQPTLPEPEKEHVVYESNEVNKEEIVQNPLLDEMLDEITDEIISTVRPIEWQRAEFDGYPENFSYEDFEKAKVITKKYFDNYSKVQTVEFTMTRERIALTTNEFTKWFLGEGKSRTDNYSVEVQLARSPLYLKMSGAFANGEEFQEIVTPAGKISSGHFGRGASWVPHWLGGEKFFLERAVLKYGSSVKENVSMDYELPKDFKEHFDLSSYKNNTYDVIESVHEDIGTTRSLWFNRKTGMLDFSISKKLDVKEGEIPFFDFCVITYGEVDGIYYPVSFVGLDNNFSTKQVEKMNGLVINGKDI
jgi:hypothetical protein